MSETNKSRLLTIAVGYAIVAVFAACFLVTYAAANLSHAWMGWSDMPTSTVLIIALLVAAPLALPFIWDRLRTVKALGVELTLDEMKQTTVAVSHVLPTTIQDTQRLPPNPSYIVDIVNQISAAMKTTEEAALLAVDLGRGESWWSSRLYLLAALADDYTDIQQFIFLADSQGRKASYVGMATPKAIRSDFASREPRWEAAYRAGRSAAWPAWPPAPAPVPIPPPPMQPPTPQQEMEHIALRFGDQLSSPPGQEGPFSVPNVWVSRQLVQDWLEPDLDSGFVDAPEVVPSPALIKAILDRPELLVPLVHHGQLQLVVDRTKLAVTVAEGALTASS